MTGFADELRAGIDEAARKEAEARLGGDDYGAGAWRERLSSLRRIAQRHGVELPPGPGLAGGEFSARTAVAPAAHGGTQESRPAAGTRKETE